MASVKVTLLICDRCETEMRTDEIQGDKLDLSLKFDDPARSSLFPLRRRETLELCPDCREAFADWLGDRGETIPGLRGDTAGEEDTASGETMSVQVPDDGENGRD